MILEEIKKICPELLQLDISKLQELFKRKCPNYSSDKTWSELGLDELDVVEIIMEMEKQFDFVFPDLLFDEIFSIDKTPSFVFQLIRESKLSDLGID